MEWIGWVIGFLATTAVFDAICVVLLFKIHGKHSDDSV